MTRSGCEFHLACGTSVDSPVEYKGGQHRVGSFIRLPNSWAYYLKVENMIPGAILSVSNQRIFRNSVRLNFGTKRGIVFVPKCGNRRVRDITFQNNHLDPKHGVLLSLGPFGAKFPPGPREVSDGYAIASRGLAREHEPVGPRVPVGDPAVGVDEVDAVVDAVENPLVQFITHVDLPKRSSLVGDLQLYQSIERGGLRGESRISARTANPAQTTCFFGMGKGYLLDAVDAGFPL